MPVFDAPNFHVDSPPDWEILEHAVPIGIARPSRYAAVVVCEMMGMALSKASTDINNSGVRAGIRNNIVALEKGTAGLYRSMVRRSANVDLDHFTSEIRDQVRAIDGITQAWHECVSTFVDITQRVPVIYWDCRFTSEIDEEDLESTLRSRQQMAHPQVVWLFHGLMSMYQMNTLI